MFGNLLLRSIKHTLLVMLSVTGGFIVGVSDFLSIFRAAKTCCSMSQWKRVSTYPLNCLPFHVLSLKSNFHWNRNHKFTNQTTFSLHNISLSIKVRRSAAALTFSKQNVLDANCALVPKYVFFAQKTGAGGESEENQWKLCLQEIYYRIHRDAWEKKKKSGSEYQAGIS